MKGARGREVRCQEANMHGVPEFILTDEEMHRIADAVVKTKLSDQGDMSEGYHDTVYRRAVVSVLEQMCFSNHDQLKENLDCLFDGDGA
jgi:hypothetical protein